jgi:hypothetical protein
MMTNISPMGARLCFTNARRLPRRFDIVFRTGYRAGARFVWQRGAVVGIEFDRRSQDIDVSGLRNLFGIDKWVRLWRD